MLPRSSHIGMVLPWRYSRMDYFVFSIVKMSMSIEYLFEGNFL